MYHLKKGECAVIMFITNSQGESVEFEINFKILKV